jgi:hypothetical protein
MRGRFIGYEYDRMVVLFSMLDGQREVPCAISTSAMDELEGVVRARAGQREAQFMRLRERIEACADGKHRAAAFEGTPPDIILRGIDFRDRGQSGQEKTATEAASMFQTRDFRPRSVRCQSQSFGPGPVLDENNSAGTSF